MTLREPASELPGPRTDSELPAEFGLGTATFVIVASMVGVGVLTTSGYTVNSVGSNQLMLVLWVVGGVSAVCAALTLAELSAALPRAGGEFVILYEAYGPLAAFLSGWVTFIMGFAAPTAAAANVSATYLLAPFRDLPQVLKPALGSLAIVVFALIHVSGRQLTVRVQGSITIVKLLLLVIFVLAGLAIGWRNAAHLNDLPPLTWPTVTAMLFSLVYITYAYFGWNAASYLAGEVRDPARDLPLSIVLGTAAVTFLYLAINIVYALALSAAQVQQIAQPNPQAVEPIAELAATRLFGQQWAAPLSIAFGLMLLSSLSAYILTGPRIAYAMARADQFPAVAGRLWARYQTPAFATIILAGISLLMLWTGTFEQIMVFASVGMAIFSILTIGAVYVLRWRRPDLKRPFRTPGYPFIPAIYLLITALLIGASFGNERSRFVSFSSLVCIAAGIPFYGAWRLLRGRRVA